METFSSKTLKARKEHNCNFCCGKIGKEQDYIKSTHNFDGHIYDFKTHKYCAELADKLKMYDDADDGVTQDMFMEIVSSAHDDIMINLFTDVDRKKYEDVIGQIRRVNWTDKFHYVLKHFKNK